MEDMTNEERREPDIYVGNLSFETEEGEIYKLFAEFGQVKHVKLHRTNGEFRGVAFVGMDSRESAQNAINSLDQTTQRGRKVKVSFAQIKTPARRGDSGRGDQQQGFYHSDRYSRERGPSPEERYVQERRDPPFDRRDGPMDRRGMPMDRRDLPVDRRDVMMERREFHDERRNYPPDDFLSSAYPPGRFVQERREPQFEREMQFRIPQERRDIPPQYDRYPPSEFYAQDRYPMEEKNLAFQRQNIPQALQGFEDQRRGPIVDDRYNPNQRFDEGEMYQRKEGIGGMMPPIRDPKIVDVYRTDPRQTDLRQIDPRYRN